MYQEELFARVIKTQGQIGSGLYAKVHAIDDEWVVKYTRMKDGTLNYLEWCKSMQDAGMGMKGMPTIDRVVHLEGGGYMVTMRRLAATANAKDVSYSGMENIRASAWYRALEQAYDEHLKATFDYKWTGFNDCHGGNIMWDAGNESWVVTDPDSSEYRSNYTMPLMAYAEAEAVIARPVPVLPAAPSGDQYKGNALAGCNCTWCSQIRRRQDARKHLIDIRLDTAALRRLPSVQIADMPSLRPVGLSEPVPAEAKIKVRRANTAEKRAHYKKNPPPSPWYRQGLGRWQ